MGLFKKKGPDRDELIRQGIAESEQAAAGGDKSENEVSTGNQKVDIELTKIKAQLESFGELRKANQERFSRISEQTGELRGMIIDTNKAMSKIEVAATKAVDLVESVHPEKLMVEVRKQDGKIAALRAMIESNETIMKDIMSELKNMRSQMNFYKGTEQVLKMNEEVKKEMADMKKMEAVIERHADRVETIFSEVEKKFSNFDKYDSVVKELKENMRKLTTDFEKTKAEMIKKEDKKEFVDLLNKFNDFEKHTTNLLKLLDDRSKIVKKEITAEFNSLKQNLVDEVKSGKVEKEADKQKKDDDAKKAQEEAEQAEKEAKEAAEKNEQETKEALEAAEKSSEESQEGTADTPDVPSGGKADESEENQETGAAPENKPETDDSASDDTKNTQ